MSTSQKIFNVVWTLKKQGYRRRNREHVVYADSTLRKIGKRLRLLSERVCLDEPEKVMEFLIDFEGWKNSYKEDVANCYDHYARINGLSWSKPVFNREPRLPNVPTKEQIALIKGESIQKYALAFSLIEEWGLRPIELHETRVRDIDLERGINNIQTKKWGMPRQTGRLKPSTLAMLKDYLVIHNFGFNDRLFPIVQRMRAQWNRAKRRIVRKLHDPTILKFRLYDLRHYYGTMLYHKTKDILYVKEKMGHRSIKNTLVYTHLVSFSDEEYTSAVAETVDEARKLIEAGFEYVTEMDEASLFRKRK